MNLDDLYSELILEYSKEIRFRKTLEPPKENLRGVNPSCGDEIELEVKIEDDVIKGIGLLGSGCAISMASANMMGTIVEGLTVAEAKERAEIFLDMIQKGERDEEKLDLLEDAQVLQNISRMPARVKCAVLAWHTLKNLLEEHEKNGSAS